MFAIENYFATSNKTTHRPTTEQQPNERNYLWTHFNTQKKEVFSLNMSTAIMQTGAMGWDYKFHDWNESNDVGDIQLKVSISQKFIFKVDKKKRLILAMHVQKCAFVCEMSETFFSMKFSYFLL